MKRLIVFVCAALLVYGCSPDKSEDSLRVRLDIFAKREKLTFKADGLLKVRDKNGSEKLLEKFVLPINRDDLCPIEVSLAEGDGQGCIRIYSAMPMKKYKGRIEADVKNGKFLVYNSVSRHDYLLSVLSSEMGGVTEELEALKVQAVLSRSILQYLLNEGKELSDLQGSFQAYRGCGFETEAAAEALRQTAGEVLKYKGRSVYPYFHSSSCGFVIHADAALGMPPFSRHKGMEPFLDEYRGENLSESSPHSRWSFSISYKTLQSVFGLEERILSVRFMSNGLGINTNAVFITERGKLNVKGHYFKRSLERAGITGLKSLCFKPFKRSGGFSAKGRGFGHLCGLPQYSAIRFCELGETYDEVLKHYFPECRIEGMDE